MGIGTAHAAAPFRGRYLSYPDDPLLSSTLGDIPTGLREPLKTGDNNTRKEDGPRDTQPDSNMCSIIDKPEKYILARPAANVPLFLPPSPFEPHNPRKQTNTTQLCV